MDTPQGIRYRIGYPEILVPGDDAICHFEWGVYLSWLTCILLYPIITCSSGIHCDYSGVVSDSVVYLWLCTLVCGAEDSHQAFICSTSRSDFKIHTSTSLPWCTSVFYLWILWYIGDISKCLDLVKEWTTSLLTNACSWVEVVMDIQYFVLEAQVLIKIAGIVFFVGHHFWHQPVEAGEKKCLAMRFTSSFFKYIFSKEFHWSDEERDCRV